MKTPNLIALVDSCPSKLNPNNGSSFGNDIAVCIGRLCADDNKPRNYSHQYDEREDTAGGQTARIYAYRYTDQPVTCSLSLCGPSISFGQEREYLRAAKGLGRVNRKLETIRDTRGPAGDAAEEMGRWLEAAGITKVYSRPEGCRTSWLTDGDWNIESIGQFVARVRMIIQKSTAADVSVAA